MDFIKRIEQLVESNEFEKALDEISRLPETQKQHPDILNMLGQISSFGGLPEEASSFFLQALKSQPNNADYLYNAAYSAFQQKNYAQALGWIEKCEQQPELTWLDEASALKSQIQSGMHERGKRKVLMIAYYFPPLAGSGVFRSLKLAKYLPNYQWSPTVISAAKPPKGWNFSDDSLLGEVPSDIKMQQIEDPLGGCENIDIQMEHIQKILFFLSTVLWGDSEAMDLISDLRKDNKTLPNLLIFPDRSLWWAQKVAQHIEQNINLQEFDLIYTTSGPCCSHLVGCFLKKKYNLPWVADFRDEWINYPYGPDPDIFGNPYHRLLYHLEKRVVASANHTVCVSDQIRQNYIGTYKVTPSRISTITNGYDEEDFRHIQTKKEKNDRFTIIYSGIIYSKYRDISPLLSALRELISEGKIRKDLLRFNLIGNPKKSNDALQRLSDKFDLKDVLRFYGYTAHRETLQFCMDADLLFCMIGNTDKCRGYHSGKLFDYLRCGHPILAFAPHYGEAEFLLKQTGHGICLLDSEKDKIKEVIFGEYTAWRQSTERSFLQADNLYFYERSHQARIFADIFSRCITEKEEIGADVYDELYLTGGAGKSYHKNYKQSVYYGTWKQILSYFTFLNRDISIIDIGCGAGQFANMLFDQGFCQYKGLDFSEKAISIAKKMNPEFADRFMVGDAFHSTIFDTDYELVILFEILEHLSGDLELLEKIKPGKKVLFSVPNFPDRNHVRYFSSIEQVTARYGKIVNILDAKAVELNRSLTLYYIAGIKR